MSERPATGHEIAQLRHAAEATGDTVLLAILNNASPIGSAACTPEPVCRQCGRLLTTQPADHERTCRQAHAVHEAWKGQVNRIRTAYERLRAARHACPRCKAMMVCHEHPWAPRSQAHASACARAYTGADAWVA